MNCLNVSLFDENIKKFHIRKYLLIIGLDLDPEWDPDPDPHPSKILDPDPHIMNADPKHWRLYFQTYGFPHWQNFLFWIPVYVNYKLRTDTHLRFAGLFKLLLHYKLQYPVPVITGTGTDR
jgi:hypothetical protein